jgi:hypothetical protein
MRPSLQCQIDALVSCAEQIGEIGLGGPQCEHSISAFYHTVDVTIQVALAKGFAVLGAARDHPDRISQMIREARAAVGHRRYGVDPNVSQAE